MTSSYADGPASPGERRKPRAVVGPIAQGESAIESRDDAPRQISGHVHRAGTPAADEGLLDLGGTLATLRRQWPRILIGTSVVVVAGILYLALAPKRYAATATIRIDSRTNTLPTIYTDQATRDEVFTEIEVMRSRTIASDVVDSLGLEVSVVKPKSAWRTSLLRSVHVGSASDTGTIRLQRTQDGRFAVVGTADTLRIGVAGETRGVALTLAPDAARSETIELHVDPREETITTLRKDVDIGRAGLQASIIALQYEADDPRLARDVLNAWTSSFIGRRQSVQRSEATSTASFIQAQLDTLMPQLSAAESKLLAYRNAQRIVAPEVEANTQVTQSALLQADRNALDAERSSLDQALTRVAAQARGAPADAPSPYRDLLGFPTLLRNQAASELLRSLSALDDQRTQLLIRRTAVDPDVVALTQRIRTVERQLQSLATTYLRGLTAQIASVDNSLSAYSSKLRQIPTQEVEYARLERAPKVYEELASLLQTRLKEAQITEAVTDASVRVVDQAVALTTPSSPKKPLVLALSTVVGLLFGCGLALRREQRTHAVRSRVELERVGRSPVLGMIPTLASAQRMSSRVVPALGTLPAIAASSDARRSGVTAMDRANRLAVMEAFTRLLMNVRWSATQPVHSLLVASPLPGDGKTTNALYLAASAAHQQRRVLLVDADVRRGGLSAALSVAGQPGLNEIARGDTTLAACRCTVMLPGDDTIDVVSAGTLSDDLSVAALMNGVERVLREAGEYDLVVIDTSPINIVADAAALASITDGVVVVARSGVTSPAALDVALEQLERAGAQVLGTVLNAADLRASDGYGSMADYRAYAAVAG